MWLVEGISPQQLKLDRFHKFPKPLSMGNVSEGALKSLCEVCRD